MKYIYLKIGYTIYYSLTLLIMKYNRDRRQNTDISKKFIAWNNRRVLRYTKNKKIKANEVAILLPHCIQKYDCPLKITSEISNCKECGLCRIGDIVGLNKKYGTKAKVATGGTLARMFIKEERPKLVIAVACERDLVSGIYDSFPMPVYGVFNRIINGPCINTDVAIEEIEGILKDLKGC